MIKQFVVRTAGKMEVNDLFLYTRLFERVAISTIIVGMAVVLMAIYRRRLQKIDVAVERDGVTVRSTVTLALPIFLFLALILYAWISLSNPVSVSSRADEIDKNPGAITSMASGFGGQSDSLSELAQNLWAIQLHGSRLAQSRLPDGTSEEFREIISEVIADAGKLDPQLFKLLSSKFDGQVVIDCMPSILLPKQPVNNTKCNEFNIFLFGKN